MPVKPIVVTSRCLGFDSCRYNGDIVSAPFVQKLADHVHFLTVCPEVEIGLGTPRDPIRIVAGEGGRRLIQPTTGRDLTQGMESFGQDYLDSLSAVDGFILKSRSPSCAIRDANIHLSTEKKDVAGRGSGLFAQAVLERFPYAAIEDEGRLTNPRSREHFLTQLFVRARFRLVREALTIRRLIQFQAENKLLLMAYSQTKMRLMGQILGRCDEEKLLTTLEDYGDQLGAALSRAPRHTSNIDVLMHGFGYFSDHLSSHEKSSFLSALESYREKRIPLGRVAAILETWIARFRNDYLASQTFFYPYPKELDLKEDVAC